MSILRSLRIPRFRPASVGAVLLVATQAWSTSAPLPVTASSSNVEETPASSSERAKKEKLLADIEQQIEKAGGRRIRYMSPQAQDSEVFGTYCHALRSRIEARGTAHFPESNGHKLYGHLTVNLRIDASGKLVETDLVRGSGNATLDRFARETASAAAPFGAFTPGMRAQADEIVYTAHFNFAHQADSAASAQSGTAP